MRGSRRSWMLAGTFLLALPFGGCNCGQRHEGLAGESGIPQGPPRLDFGNVAVGQSIRLPVWLSNAGTAPLDLLSQSTSGPPFSEPTPFAATSLLPGGKGNAVVAFSPTAPGPFSGTLTIDGDGEPTALVIPMTGVGFDIAVTARPHEPSPSARCRWGIKPAPTQTADLRGTPKFGRRLSLLRDEQPGPRVHGGRCARDLHGRGERPALAAGASLALTVAFEPDAGLDLQLGLHLHHLRGSDHPELPRQPVHLAQRPGGLQASFPISPNPIVFSSVPGGQHQHPNHPTRHQRGQRRGDGQLPLLAEPSGRLPAGACEQALLQLWDAFGGAARDPGRGAGASPSRCPTSSSGSTADTDVLAAALHHPRARDAVGRHRTTSKPARAPRPARSLLRRPR